LTVVSDDSPDITNSLFKATLWNGIKLSILTDSNCDCGGDTNPPGV